MNKTKIILGAIVALLLGGGGYSAVENLGSQNAAPASTVIVGSKSNSNVLSFGSFSTTTPTTTEDIIVGTDYDEGNLALCMIASSTLSRLDWYYEYSDDGTNWYGQDANSITSNAVSHESATTTHSWNPAVTTQTCKNVDLESLHTNWLRFVLYRSSALAPGQNFYLTAEATLYDKQ